jgi:hypothetical protein
LTAFDPDHQGVMRHLNQPFRLARQLASGIHAAGIAEPAIHDYGHINVQDVAILQLFVARNAVTNNMVQADAACMLIALVTDGR